jgi:hypothetical protein
MIFSSLLSLSLIISDHCNDLVAPKKIDFNFRRLSRQELHSLSKTNERTSSPSSQVLNKNINNNNNRASQESLLMTSSSSVLSSSPSGSILRCFVENVYPVPEVMIFGVRRDGTRYRLLNTMRREEGTNNTNSVYLTTAIDDLEVMRRYEEDGHSLTEEHFESQHPFHYSQQSIPGVHARSASNPSSSLRSPPVYQFECIYSMDINNGVKNYTRVSSMTYSPLQAKDSKDAQISSLSSASLHLSLSSFLLLLSHLIFLSRPFKP